MGLLVRLEQPIDAIPGQCGISTGDAERYSECEDICDCADGLPCIGGVCAPICDPAAESGPAACPDGEKCINFWWPGAHFGGCHIECQVFDDDSPRPDGHHCSPTFESVTDGYCTPFGRRLEGDPCSNSESCTEGTRCMASECRRFCDPAAAMGELGGCEEGEVCSGVFVYGEAIAWGVCEDKKYKRYAKISYIIYIM